ncbi:MAG: autotransporter-associated beta strand repeat-containing protein [Verrucomicrobia bacterium]|nr:autotransporter-associated beta strand repeat-containing protein [Verrucomicrobiota bacterium]
MSCALKSVFAAGRWFSNRRLRPGLLPMFFISAFLLLFSERQASAYLASDVPTIVNGYSNTFYFTSGTNGYFRDKQGSGNATYFWQIANEIESVIDAYEWTTNTVYLGMITNLLNGFIKSNGANWSYNGYNDDDLWAVMAFARGGAITGKTNYCAIAKSNFDMVYARGWDTNLGGGLYWLYPKNSSKNACVNGPGAIAASLLFQVYGDTNYWIKATNIYYWERAVLYNSATGRIYDNINTNGNVDQTPTTYNQGTFLGAADFLGQTNDALLAATYTMNSMSGVGYMPRYGIGGNNSIFNSIFIRWLGKFMKNRSITAPYQIWLQGQANATWNGRRMNDNLSWCQWPQLTPVGTNFYSYDCISSFEAMIAIPPTQTTNPTVVTLTATDASGASSFESGLNWSDGTTPSSAHDYIVSGFTLRSPADAGNHFFAGNSLTLSNGAVLACKNTSGGKGVAVGTELFLDNGEVADWAANSTEFSGRVTLRSGGGRLDPQGNTFTISALIGGPGMLRIKGASGQTGGTLIFSGNNSYTGGTVIDAPQTLQLSGYGDLGDVGGSLMFSNTASLGYGTLNLGGSDLSVGNLNGGGGKIVNNAAMTTSTFTIGTSNASGGTFYGIISDNTSVTGLVEVVKVGAGTLKLCATNICSAGVTISGGVLQFGDGVRNGATAGSITNNAALVFANPTALVCTNFIAGSGSLTKISAGKLTLSNASVHSGATIVGAGTLAVVDAGALANSSSLAISNAATLDVSGKSDKTFTLASGRALQGSGNIFGNLSLLSGSKLNPGDAIGTLTVQSNINLAGTLVMELNRTNIQPNDKLTSTGGTISGGGALAITNLGPALQGGDGFQLFNQPVNGFASLTLPALPVGNIWQNNLSLNGSVRVVATNSANLAIGVSANQIAISWPSDHTGWRLQIQTNDALTGLNTNWVDVPGVAVTNQAVLPMSVADASVFFRLTYP